MDKKLVSKSQIKRAFNVRGAFGNAVASATMSVAGLNRLNRLYSHVSEYQGIDFADHLLEQLNVKCDIAPEEFDNLPKEGPFIIVSNHPFGGLDGIIMLHLFGRLRPDLKILTNFILSHIPNLKEFFFPVNPFTDNKGLKSSLKGIRMATEHLKNGGVLGLFPAGEVSSNANKERVVKDIEWQPSIIKLIKKAGVPVVPIYFDGGNSKYFHFLGRINKYLRTLRLPGELSNKKDKTVSIRIGRPVTVLEIEEFVTLKDLGNHLWNRTYALEANVRGQENDAVGSIEKEKIASPVDKDILIKEIESRGEDLLFEVKDYSCYLFNAQNIPNLIKELGIRREEAFRSIGEGSNKEIDTDEYDPYYKHLVLWNKKDNAVIGAYRLGFGDEILFKYGLEGFYSNTLFRYRPEFKTYLKRAIELGRSFVSNEYQKDPLALMLLIKGLMYTVIKNPQVRFLIGPVSISASYPIFYRSLMIHYLKLRHSRSAIAKWVNPKFRFVPDFYRVDVDSLLKGKLDSVEKFDRFMFRLSNNRFRLPTLLKKYIKINSRIIAYNIDPDFNNCVDGLIMLDVYEVPKQEIDSLSKEMADKTAVYKRFGITEEEV